MKVAVTHGCIDEERASALVVVRILSVSSVDMSEEMKSRLDHGGNRCKQCFATEVRSSSRLIQNGVGRAMRENDIRAERNIGPMTANFLRIFAMLR